MGMNGVWDYDGIGRGVTRDEVFYANFNPALVAAVGGPRHAEFVQYAQRIEKLIPPLQGLFLFEILFYLFINNFSFRQ